MKKIDGSGEGDLKFTIMKKKCHPTNYGRVRCNCKWHTIRFFGRIFSPKAQIGTTELRWVEHLRRMVRKKIHSMIEKRFIRKLRSTLTQQVYALRII